MHRRLFHIVRRRPIYWRLTFYLIVVAITLSAASLVISTIWQGDFFPKIACPGSSGFSQDQLPTRLIESSVIKDLGNWSFEEPAKLTRLCRPGERTAPVSKPMRRSLTLLALVPMTINMKAERDDLRNTWGGQLNKEFGQLLFLVQIGSGNQPPVELTRENQKHQDILIAYHSGEDSLDTYDLLVRKVLAGLHWFSKACHQGFDFVLKADHDSYWNVASLVRLLVRHRPSEPLVLGSVQEGAVVSRDARSKFYVSKKTYPYSRFPPYASGGPGYVISRAAAMAIVKLAELHTPRSGALWLEDVYITGVLPALGYSACNCSSSPEFFHLHSDYVFICRYSAFTAATVKRWPPLAMHRVLGHQLHHLHEWLSDSSAAEVANKLHSIVYSRSSCPFACY